MRKLRAFIVIALTTVLLINPLVAFAQEITLQEILKTTNTGQVIEKSPSDFELENAKLFYTNAINEVSPQGKQFAQEHEQITQRIIGKIDALTASLLKTRALNQEYTNNYANQVVFWGQATRYNQLIQPILNKEMKIFIRTEDSQFIEVFKWTLIDSYIQTISQIEPGVPVNRSLNKSELYTNLLGLYTDLMEFYNKKYQLLFYDAAILHASEENPNSGLTSHDINQIKPYHKREMEIIHSMLMDYDKKAELVMEINNDLKEYKRLYNRMDMYSIAEADKVIKSFESQKAALVNKADKTPDNKLNIDLLDAYVNYYRALKNTLKTKKLTSDIQEAIIASKEQSENEKLAYTGMIITDVFYAAPQNLLKGKYYLSEIPNNSAGGGDDKWKIIGKGVDTVGAALTTVARTGYAAIDYGTSRYGDLYYRKEETQLFINNQLEGNNGKNPKAFVNNFNNWNETFIKAGETLPTKTIRNTIIDPMANTYNYGLGHPNSIGQQGVQTASGSFKTVDSTLAGVTKAISGGYLGEGQFVSQVALSTITLGGYGLGKDFTTINNINATEREKTMAAITGTLAFLPGISTARTTERGLAAYGSQAAKNEAAFTAVQTAKNELQTAASALANAQAKAAQEAGNLATLRTIGVPEGVLNLQNQMVRITGANAAEATVAKTAAEGVLTRAIQANIGNVKDPLSETIRTALAQLIGDSTANFGNRFLQQMFNETMTQAKNNAPQLISILGQGWTNYFVSRGVDQLVNKALRAETFGLIFPDDKQVNTNQPMQIDPNWKDPTAMQKLKEYLQNNPGLAGTTGSDGKTLEQILNEYNENQQNFNAGRNNPGVGGGDPQTSSSTGTTGSIIERVQQLSGQTGGNQPCPTGTSGNGYIPPASSGSSGSGPCSGPCPTGGYVQPSVIGGH